MREVTPETAAEYLRDKGRLGARGEVRVRALGWGVSNVVMRIDVEGPGGGPFVLKQARERLRTRAHWVSRLERIWTERAALELLGSVLPEGVVPRVLFSEQDDYLFAMTCAPDDSVVWKERLLAGVVEEPVARAAGAILGTMHAGTLGHPALEALPLADTRVFDELRIEPFYRAVARVHPALAPRLEVLADRLPAGRPKVFVHADFSPKNILVHGGGLTVVDFETAHAGDAAYDLGFVLSHLLLKAVRSGPAAASGYFALADAFWAAYGERVQAGPIGDDAGLVSRACAHAAACALARVDGTSPVDYLDEPGRAVVRRFARAALTTEPSRWDDLVELLAYELRQLI